MVKVGEDSTHWNILTAGMLIPVFTHNVLYISKKRGEDEW